MSVLLMSANNEWFICNKKMKISLFLIYLTFIYNSFYTHCTLPFQLSKSSSKHISCSAAISFQFHHQYSWPFLSHPQFLYIWTLHDRLYRYISYILLWMSTDDLLDKVVQFPKINLHMMIDFNEKLEICLDTRIWSNALETC